MVYPQVRPHHRRLVAACALLLLLLCLRLLPLLDELLVVLLRLDGVQVQLLYRFHRRLQHFPRLLVGHHRPELPHKPVLQRLQIRRRHQLELVNRPVQHLDPALVRYLHLAKEVPVQLLQDLLRLPILRSLPKRLGEQLRKKR